MKSAFAIAFLTPALVVPLFAEIPQCKGVSLTAAERKVVASSKTDPAKESTGKETPRRIACESAMWKARHLEHAAPATNARTGLLVPPAPDFGTVDADAPNDVRGVRPILSPPLRHVHPIPPPRRGDNEDRAEPPRPAPLADGGPDLSLHQLAPGPVPSAPTSTGLSFDGVGVGLGGFQPSSNPPDVNGRVGATQYVQWNNTSFAVFNKATGALLYGPAAGNTLFQSLGGACATHNDGDPVVSYDILAGRWVLSQFVVGASPNYSHQCFAVSLTGDATGAYYLYDFVTDATAFVDYPHVGVWPDGYYMSTHVFNASTSAQTASRVYVFERTSMINGQTARMQSVNLPKDGSQFQYGFLPADLDSITPPPAGAQEYIIGPNAQFTNRTNLWRLAVTWGVTPTITLSSETTNTTVGLGNAPCVSNTSGQKNRDCVPQLGPGGGANIPTDDLDNISRHYLHRLAYMNHGGTESILATGVTVGAATTPAHGAIKWMEWRGATGSNPPTLFQSGTYDPTSTQSDYRWMPSIAMDTSGNIAIGYSKSSNTTRPSIWITGRLSGDTTGTMGAETLLQAGGGVQTAGAGNRWGDYTSMTLDPIDQCTFWYVNEYLKTDGTFNWSTRIASYSFPSCTAAPAWGTISGTITSCATGAPISGVVVTLSNGFAAASDASGAYSIPVPAGTYTATASDSNRNCTSCTPTSASVTSTSGTTTTRDFCMTGNSNLQSNGVTIDDSPGNNNGKINANECVIVNVNLKNNGCATESGISATMSTTTPGVTITQPNSNYSNLVIDASANNTTPFRIQTSNSFVCGTIINLTLNLTYAGGSKSVGVSLPTCGGGPTQSIPASTLTASDLSQPDRLARDGVPSTCNGKACPGAINSAGTRRYKKFTFTNSGGSTACLTVSIDATGCGTDIESAAYLNTYTPPTAQGDAAGNLCLGYLGDSGISGLGTTVNSASYDVSVPANSNVVVVVTTAAGSTTCSNFSGTLSGFFDFTPASGLPAPTITPGGATTFCSGSSVQLSSSSASGNQWYKDGTAIPGETNQLYTATTAGSYTVAYTTNTCASPQSPAVNVTVNPSPATPTASNTGPYCAGATISLSTPTVASATYAWTGPNGFTSALQNPTRANATTADAGTYSVTVTVSGCTSAAGTTNVVVNAIPATPTASNGGPYCAGATIQLSTPTVASATYAWTGPNGFTSALQNPTRANATTADAGTYSVTVTVNGCTSAAGTTSVVVNTIPATPTASNTGPYCAGATISLSTPTVASATYAWTGPNGFTSALQNPTRANSTTADAGTYSVTVTVNGCTSAAGTTSVVVNPIPATPTASNTGAYCAGATISLSTPTVASATYAWTGPNGFTSALQNPTRANATTADAGTYSVTVTVNGCTSAAGTTNVVVNAIPATPTASNGGPYCAGATIQLSTPTVAGATYAWTGPNGFTSALQNPTRANATTADAGTYSVTATVNGCTSAAGTTSVVVNPIPATPAASNGGPYCEGATIALSTPAVSGATYSWTGPNGFTSALQNPTRTSATTADAGTYSVTVTVNGCTSAAGTTNVVVNATPATPTASNGGPYCAGATIALSTPAVASATYAWTGPNSFTSALQNPTRTNAATADAGTYSVTITVNGCTSAAGTTSVVVNATPAAPTASNGGPYCEGATVALSTPTVSGATYSWTGPNGFTSALQNPTRSNATTADAGTYFVTITVNGCTSAAGSTTVVVNAIPATPTASNGGPYCEGATIALATPTVSGATYSWTGPNGFTSALQNPTRANATTADAGTYSVTITVNGCTSAAGTTNVVVNATPATPTASNGGPYCEGATIQLSTPTVSGATYSWTGPNGFTSALQNPTRSNATTADAGTYSVTITVNGCTSAAGTTNVVVNAAPATPTASNGGPYCTGATIQLSTPTVSGASYSWTGPSGFTSSLQNPTATDAGTYFVTITVNGCTSAAGSTTAVINPIPATPTASNGGPYCEGATIALATPTVSGATYTWTGPNGFTSALQNPTRSNVTTADAGTYSVTITVNGCTSAAGTTNVVVNATPATPTATNGGPYCTGATIQLSTPAVSGATYSWTGPSGFTSSQQNPTATDAGTYFVTITVSGCTSAAGSTTVVVNPIPAAPSATNGGPYCAGATIQLNTPAVGGATYGWTGPNGFSSSLQNPTRSNAAAADAGTYSVTITVNGCTSAAGTTDVVVNAAPPTPTISPAGSITFCFRDPVTLTSSSASGNQWYVFDTPLAGETGQTLLVTRDLITAHSQNFAAYFSVTVTGNGCSTSSAQKLVEVLTPGTPVISAAGPTTFCTGGSVDLSAANESSSGQWYRDGIEINSATTGFYTAVTSGSYTFVDRFYATCPSDPSNAIVVTVNPIPSTPTASNGGPYCQGATIQLSTPAVSGATYSWTGPNSFASSQQNPTGTVAGTYFVTVTQNGCTSAAGSTTVVVNPVPATPAASNGGPYCTGATIQLSTPSVSGATYAWTGPSGFTSSLQNPTASNAGTYFVTLTVNGCTSAAGSTTVVVNPIPATPTITPGGPTSFCTGGSVTLTSSSATGNQWYLNGNLINSAANNTYSASASGNYTVVVTTNGCSSAASAPVTVTASATPTPTIGTGGPTTFCSGGSVTLTSSSASGNQWYRDGVLLPSETGQNTIASIGGSYTVVVTNSGCASSPSAATVVTVNPGPNATIYVPSPMYLGASGIAYVKVSCIGATFSWGITNGTITSGNGSPWITFVPSTAGTTTITVTVTNASGCSDTKSVNVTVQTAAFGAPPYMRADATSTSTVLVRWAFVTSTDHYEIWRSTDGVNFTLRGTSTSTTFSESGLTPSTAYFYKVRSVKADTTTSAFSAIDPATTVTFTDDLLMSACKPIIKGTHITQLRTAINIARASVGLGAFSFTDPTLPAGTIQVKAVHVRELRTALGGVLSVIGVTPAYTDPTLIVKSTVVKGLHIQELRELLR